MSQGVVAMFAKRSMKMTLDAHKSAVAKAYGLAGVSANRLHGFARFKAHCRMALSYSIFFPIQHHSGDPLHKAHPAGPGKHCGKRPQKRLHPSHHCVASFMTLPYCCLATILATATRKVA
jgi:hypothetical protein